VATQPDGGFIVVWDSAGSAGSDTNLSSIQGQRYAASGAPVGGEFQVNSYTTSYQYAPSVATQPDGGFVVVWTSHGSTGGDTFLTSIQAQRYDSDGLQLGGEFQVNTYTTGAQFRPSVATEPGGGFVVVWTSYGSTGGDTSASSIQGQRLASSGAPTGGQFQVNTYTTSYQFFRPSVATDPDGGFVVVWYSDGADGTDTSSHSIQGQRFAPEPGSLFGALATAIALGLLARHRRPPPAQRLSSLREKSASRGPLGGDVRPRTGPRRSRPHAFG
jgi:hypothetical protein